MIDLTDLGRKIRRIRRKIRQFVVGIRSFIYAFWFLKSYNSPIDNLPKIDTCFLKVVYLQYYMIENMYYF